MAKGIVLDPTTVREDDITSPGPDFGDDLAGKTIGIRIDQMWRSWDWISEIWAKEFEKAGAKVKYWRSNGRSGEEGERQARELDEFIKTIDCAIVGLANCGSCTGWTVRDSLTAAAAGLPTVAIATANFEEFAKTIAQRGGRSGLRVHVLPYPLNERLKEDVDPVAHEHFPKLLVTMGASIAKKAAA